MILIGLVSVGRTSKTTDEKKIPKQTSDTIQGGNSRVSVCVCVCAGFLVSRLALGPSTVCISKVSVALIGSKYIISLRNPVLERLLVGMDGFCQWWFFGVFFFGWSQSNDFTERPNTGEIG